MDKFINRKQIKIDLRNKIDGKEINDIGFAFLEPNTQEIDVLAMVTQDDVWD